MLRVLLVEHQNVDVQVAVAQHLLGQGYDVDTVQEPDEVLLITRATWPDLIVLNVCGELPGAAEMCRLLDGTQLDIPRLIVHDGDQPKSLKADAYIEVPFTVRKLSFRIRKAVGRQTDRFARLGDIIVDRVKHNVKHGEIVAHMTPKEMRLLVFLMQFPGKPVTRGVLMKQVWDTDYVGDTRTLEVHIRWLRRKMEKNPKRPEHILTVRGTGYMFHVGRPATRSN